VLRYREVVRRFDTRLSERTIKASGAHAAWVSDDMLRRATGDHVWEGSADALDLVPPQDVPANVWDATRELAGLGGQPALSLPGPVSGADGERHIIARRLRLDRVPLTRVEYLFAGQRFDFVAVGHAGAERFWAQSFPPRWGRVGRFFKVLARDLNGEHPLPEKRITPQPNGTVSSLDEFRARRELHQVTPAQDDANGSTSAASDTDADPQ
jgi:hypothetical protein